MILVDIGNRKYFLGAHMAWWKSLLTSSEFKVFAFFSFTSGSVASLFLYPITEAGHAAAWVQAVGSIGAIVGAIIISKMAVTSASRLENEKEMRERGRLEFGYRCVIENLIDELKIQLKSEGVDGRLTSLEFWEKHSRLRFKSNLSAVVNLPLYDLGGKERIDAAFLIKDLAVSFDSYMDDIANGSNREVAFSTAVTDYFPLFLDALEKLERQYLDTFSQE